MGIRDYEQKNLDMTASEISRLSVIHTIREFTLINPIEGLTEHGDRVTIPEGTVMRVAEELRRA